MLSPNTCLICARYARPLSGSQRAATPCRAPAWRPSSSPILPVLGATTPPAVGLYRLFHQLWGRAALESLRWPARPQPCRGVEKLSRADPARRQALLLTAMEGFNVSDTARILERAAKRQ